MGIYRLAHAYIFFSVTLAVYSRFFIRSLPYKKIIAFATDPVSNIAGMDSLTTHPSTAQQAKAFTSPASLSFPGGAGQLTPPSSEKDGQQQTNGATGQNHGVNATNGNGLTPATPVAAPVAGQGQGVSGIVPVLQ